MPHRRTAPLPRTTLHPAAPGPEGRVGPRAAALALGGVLLLTGCGSEPSESPQGAAEAAEDVLEEAPAFGEIRSEVAERLEDVDSLALRVEGDYDDLVDMLTPPSTGPLRWMTALPDDEDRADDEDHVDDLDGDEASAQLRLDGAVDGSAASMTLETEEHGTSIRTAEGTGYMDAVSALRVVGNPMPAEPPEPQRLPDEVTEAWTETDRAEQKLRHGWDQALGEAATAVDRMPALPPSHTEELDGEQVRIYSTLPEDEDSDGFGDEEAIEIAVGRDEDGLRPVRIRDGSTELRLDRWDDAAAPEGPDTVLDEDTQDRLVLHLLHDHRDDVEEAAREALDGDGPGVRLERVDEPSETPTSTGRGPNGSGS